MKLTGQGLHYWC